MAFLAAGFSPWCRGHADDRPRAPHTRHPSPAKSRRNALFRVRAKFTFDRFSSPRPVPALKSPAPTAKMDTQSPSATSPVPLTMPVAGGEDALRATLAAALEALETERAARQRAEAALQERDRRLDEVERLASLGSWEQVLAEPLDQQPVRWSAEQLRIHGLDEATAPATFAEVLERVHPDDRQDVRDACATVIRTGDSNAAAYRVVRADGQFRWLYAQAQRIPDPDGGPPRLIGTIAHSPSGSRTPSYTARSAVTCAGARQLAGRVTRVSTSASRSTSATRPARSASNNFTRETKSGLSERVRKIEIIAGVYEMLSRSKHPLPASDRRRSIAP